MNQAYGHNNCLTQKCEKPKFDRYKKNKTIISSNMKIQQKAHFKCVNTNLQLRSNQIYCYI